MANTQTTGAERRPEGEHDTHQEGRDSHQTGRTNRRAKRDNQKRERSIRQEGETPNNPGRIGGQGMGQGRGMNPGEAHSVSTPGDREDEDDR